MKFIAEVFQLNRKLQKEMWISFSGMSVKIKFFEIMVTFFDFFFTRQLWGNPMQSFALLINFLLFLAWLWYEGGWFPSPHTSCGQWSEK